MVVGLDRIRATGGPVAELSNRDQVETFLDQVRPDIVIHLAGFSHVGKSWEQPDDVMQANVVNSIILYEALGRVVGNAARFLFISSSDVFGAPPPEHLPLTEQSPVSPESPYAVSKYAAELSLRVLHQRGGPELLIARPFNHSGPGQSPKFACPSFARQIVEIQEGHRHVLRHGNLKTRRDFLDVRDAVRAYRLIVEKGKDGDMFVVASGKSHTMESIVHMLFEIAGIDNPPMEADPALMRLGESIKDLRGSSELLKKATGWEPLIPLRQTLADIIEGVRANLKYSAP